MHQPGVTARLIAEHDTTVEVELRLWTDVPGERECGEYTGTGRIEAAAPFRAVLRRGEPRDAQLRALAFEDEDRWLQALPGPMWERLAELPLVIEVDTALEKAISA
jgi:hypothetical protein